MKKTKPEICPCGSGLPYVNCCEPVHSGMFRAPTAESLMRARYSAFVIEDEDFLQRSWHSSTRPEKVLEANSGDTHWLGLNIIESKAGLAGDDKGSVEFIARFSVHNQAGQLHEVSSFVFEDGQWFYVDGVAKKGQTIKSEKVGRNEPCPCGSGKKYKKCCGR